MQVATALVLLVTCELCLAIRVPVIWDESASEVKQEIKNDNDEQFSVESFKPQNVNTNENKKPIPVEYFEYTAKKPQFAVDVAKFHGVQSPENHYKAYPIKPHTGQTRPELGKHHILDEKNNLHKPLQEYANINEEVVGHAVPVSSNYEVFHPYEAEVPALQEIYKDPILTKIRNDLENSKNMLQNYEKEAGEPEIEKDEYLESPEKTDNRFVPQRNIPAPYEIHRPQRRPIYYRPVSKPHYRENHLNQRLRHPWNQYSAKIRPVHYRPIKNHIHQLRQNHALKYDDERNEYPQVQMLENYSDPKDGYDIYERGKDKFVQLRNNVDESINKAVKENRPVTYQKLEMQPNDNNDNPEDEFVPIKNYAQVRKTETFKHLPRAAALADAESFDEIRNAPRLREAVKSTKAQTVYSEEGYEDSAYDHAGEQKHASENEGHGGYLKQHELSGGKYKTPSESAKYQDDGGSIYRDQIIHAEKWKEDNEDNKEQVDEEDYTEDEDEKSIEADEYQDKTAKDNNLRNKRENDLSNVTYTDSSDEIDKVNDNDTEHGVIKRNANFKVPELDLNSTYLTEQEISKLEKIKILQPKKDDIIQKYPYYFNNNGAISRHSPLRYAENLKLIPKKSNGGSEFYDSRSKFECPEVDDVPDPIPEKLKGEGHPDDNDNDEDEDEKDSSTKGDENYDTAKKTPRLKGLGDKIDCFKAKYFGENPLDSPFFKEEIITNPEPLVVPNLSSFKLKGPGADVEPIKGESKLSLITVDIPENAKTGNESDLFDLIEKLRIQNSELQESLAKSNEELISSLTETKNNSNDLNLKQQSSVYSDILSNIKNKTLLTEASENVTKTLPNPVLKSVSDNITYSFFQNKEDVTKSPPTVRRKRSTPFVYEPYKIIRDSQVQDSKKTTTTSNISPLIRQLQSSRVVDKVAKPNQETDSSDKHVKRNVNSRTYKDIGKKDREINGSKNDKGKVETTIIDVSEDTRRGEPRYEVRHANHKPKYTPVENKKSMSLEDYKAQTNSQRNVETKMKGESNVLRQSRIKLSQGKPAVDTDIQNIAAPSNTVRKTISTTTAKPTQKPSKHHSKDESESDEDYEEYDDDEDEDEEEEEKETIITTTTTTTRKPSVRQRVRSTTERLPESTEKPRLKLITRFRDYKPDDSSEEEEEHHAEKPEMKNRPVKKEPVRPLDETMPKYREKKKKTHKSTLVTDTKRYGDDDEDDMRKEEVDALIGVRQNMDDYMPLYEKKEENKLKRIPIVKEKHVEDEELDDDDENDDDGYDDDDDEDDDASDEDKEDENDEYEEEIVKKSKPRVTTPEPTKRTLAITTDAPTPTTATRTTKQEAKPIVTRKKIEIHKELPGNKSAPHMTQFKQDIKEVEIIKEIPIMPKRKPQKNVEVLELYKDDDLAKDINKLGGVEVFKEDIDLRNGPKHGGNYRQAEKITAAPLKENIERKPNKRARKEDAVASESEFSKNIELDDVEPSNKMHGGNLRSLSDLKKTRTRGRNAKLIELSDPPSTSMHGGNLKHRGRGRNTPKSEKLIELDDDHDNDDEDSSHYAHESFGNSRNSRPMHGGNYRSAKIVAEEKPKVAEATTTSRSRTRGGRRSGAAILNSFVQAVPILTTTPGYILDPSKRMYYYVDA